MTEKIKKIMALIEDNGLGDDFVLRGPWAVAAEEWPNESGCGVYFQYYLLFEGNIEITTTDRNKFIGYISSLV